MILFARSPKIYINGDSTPTEGPTVSTRLNLAARLWQRYLQLHPAAKVLIGLGLILVVVSLFIPKFWGSAAAAFAGVLAFARHRKEAPVVPPADQSVEAIIERHAEQQTADLVLQKKVEDAVKAAPVDWDNKTSAEPPKRLP